MLVNQHHIEKATLGDCMLTDTLQTCNSVIKPQVDHDSDHFGLPTLLFNIYIMLCMTFTSMICIITEQMLLKQGITGKVKHEDLEKLGSQTDITHQCMINQQGAHFLSL